MSSGLCQPRRRLFLYAVPLSVPTLPRTLPTLLKPTYLSPSSSGPIALGGGLIPPLDDTWALCMHLEGDDALGDLPRIDMSGVYSMQNGERRREIHFGVYGGKVPYRSTTPRTNYQRRVRGGSGGGDEKTVRYHWGNTTYEEVMHELDAVQKRGNAWYKTVLRHNKQMHHTVSPW